jgi:SnoaL-like domain
VREDDVKRRQNVLHVFFTAEPMTRMVRSLAGALALVAAGCAAPTAPGYPVVYHDALRTTSPAAPPADAEARFADLYARVHEPGFDARAKAFYANDLYFNDTLATLRTEDELVEHLRRIHDAGTHLVVTIDDAIPRGEDLYLRWTMKATFDVLGRSRTSETIGISHLRFDASGECVLQQDYWDPAFGFYRHVPLVGRLLERIRGRFDRGAS